MPHIKQLERTLSRTLSCSRYAAEHRRAEEVTRRDGDWELDDDPETHMQFRRRRSSEPKLTQTTPLSNAHGITVDLDLAEVNTLVPIDKPRLYLIKNKQ